MRVGGNYSSALNCKNGVVDDFVVRFAPRGWTSDVFRLPKNERGPKLRVVSLL